VEHATGISERRKALHVLKIGARARTVVTVRRGGLLKKTRGALPTNRRNLWEYKEKFDPFDWCGISRKRKGEKGKDGIQTC